MQIALIRSVHSLCQSDDPTNQISQTLGAYITLVTIQLSLHLAALDRSTLQRTRFLMECIRFVCHGRAKISLALSHPLPLPLLTHFFNLCEIAELLPVITRVGVGRQTAVFGPLVPQLWLIAGLMLKCVCRGLIMRPTCCHSPF